MELWAGWLLYESSDLTGATIEWKVLLLIKRSKEIFD